MKKLIFFTILAFSQIVFSQDDADNFMSVFESKPIIDIKLHELKYNRPKNGAGKGGLIRFSKFNVVTSQVDLDLENQDAVFDSDIYVKKNFLGMKGPYTKFTFNIDDENFAYVDSFRWLDFKNINLFMNEEKISLDGDYFGMREPKTQLKSTNFELLCERHPSHTYNDANGFLAGCFNYGVVRPRDNKKPIEMEFFFHGDESTSEDDIKLKSDIKTVIINQDFVRGEAKDIEVIFDSDLTLKTGSIIANCRKQEDLINISAKDVPLCLNDLTAEMDLFEIYWKKDAFKKNAFLKPKGRIDDNEIKVWTDEFTFVDVDVDFIIKNAEMTCNKTGDFSEVNGESYLLSCFNNAYVTPSDKKRTSYLKFKLVDLNVPEGSKETKVITIESDFDRFDMGRDYMSLLGQSATIRLDDTLRVSVKDIDLKCKKEKDILSFNAEKVIEECKDSARFNEGTIVIEDLEDDYRFYFDNDYLALEDTKLVAKIPAMQVVDKEESTTLFDIGLDCNRRPESDLFAQEDILEDCVANSLLTIRKIVTKENEGGTEHLYKTYENLVKSGNFNPSALVQDEKGFLKDIYIKVVDNKLVFKAKLKKFKITSYISIEAETSFNRDTMEIEIDIKNARLPLGIKSKSMLRFIVKHFVANDSVYIQDKKILIKI